MNAGRKALESFSPGIQPGAKPSQLPAHQSKKPGVLDVTPGFLRAREGRGPISHLKGMWELSVGQAITRRITCKSFPKWQAHQLTHNEAWHPIDATNGRKFAHRALIVFQNQPKKGHDLQDL